MLPFVVVGESLVDVVETPDGVHRLPGGSPLNVAVGLARLGVPTLLVTQVGDDQNGALVTEHLSASGVSVAPGSVRSGAPTSTATAKVDLAGAATYDFQISWDLDPDLPADLRALHVGSLGTVVEPGRTAVLRLLEGGAAEGVLVSYDPNVRAGFLPGWDQVRQVAALATLVKVSEDDLAALRPETATAALVHELLEAERTELVVVTRGALGALGFTRETSIEVPAPPTEVVDTVGAGDSFMAAALAVLDDWELLATGPGSLAALDEQRLRLLLSGAATAAAVTVSRRGANPPTRAELPSTWPAG